MTLTQRNWLRSTIQRYLQITGLLALWLVTFLSLYIAFRPLVGFFTYSHTISSNELPPFRAEIPEELLRKLPYYSMKFESDQEILPRGYLQSHIIFSRHSLSQPVLEPQIPIQIISKIGKKLLRPLSRVPKFISSSIRKFLRKKMRSKQDITSETVSSNESSKEITQSQNVSDHMDSPIHLFNLSKEQKHRFHGLYALLQQRLTPELREKAAISNMAITPFLLYQYIASTDWAEDYNGLSFIDAIFLTIQWRYEIYLKYYIQPDFSDIAPLIFQQMCYLSPVLDNRSRTILYFKMKNNRRRETSDLYLKLIIYMMDRAIEHSIVHQSGEFVAIIDLKGLSLQTFPPLSLVQDTLTILKRHYPYRVAEIYLVNAGNTFHFLWRMIKPFIPQKILSKVRVLADHILHSDSENLLIQNLGRENIETDYGGTFTARFENDHYVQV